MTRAKPIFVPQNLCPVFVTQTKVSSSRFSNRKYRVRRHWGGEI